MKNKFLKPKKYSINWLSSKNLVEYDTAIINMGNYIKDIKYKNSKEVIWLLEHYPVYTCGRSSKKAHLLNTKNTPVINSGRGGQITFHGPGQRIIYVMLDLKKREKDIRKYIHTLEKWIIITLKEIGIKAFTDPKRIGIWVNSSKGESKIGAIGVRLSNWVTSHGISINVKPDLSYYNGIVPCGLKNYPITSLQELGYDIKMCEFDKILKNTSNKYF